jgi:hypothetical protein
MMRQPLTGEPVERAVEPHAHLGVLDEERLDRRAAAHRAADAVERCRIDAVGHLADDGEVTEVDCLLDPVDTHAVTGQDAVPHARAPD